MSGDQLLVDGFVHSPVGLKLPTVNICVHGIGKWKMIPRLLEEESLPVAIHIHELHLPEHVHGQSLLAYVRAEPLYIDAAINGQRCNNASTAKCTRGLSGLSLQVPNDEMPHI